MRGANGTFTEDTCQREDYSYDTNPYDGSFSQNTSGRLAAVQHKGGYDTSLPPSYQVCSITFTEMYSYNSAGTPLKKRLRVSKPLAWNPSPVTSTVDLDSTYTYDNEGRMTTIQYPSTWQSNGSVWVAGPNLGNTFDSMGRLQKLTDLTASSDIISNTTYGVAGQLLTMTGANGAPSETRSYNSLYQMTQLTVGSLNVQYNYSATQNNGKITSETDVVSGEQVTYTYDSLNRLASATSSVNPGWGQSYGYDGFGNLTTQTVTKGTAPSLSVSYDPATNRQTGECADANGNLCASGYSYDIENRISYTGTARYSYAPGNKRAWRGVWSGGTQTTDEVTYWGANGQKLTTYSLGTYQQFTNSTPVLTATATGSNYYFGGKLVKNTGGYVTPDRLGSIGKYFPYGQERPSATTDGKEKFATYFRDAETGLDYAKARYHQPGMGRFMTPDPYGGSISLGNPGSWNRYSYVGGDPINRNDPSGLCDVIIGGIRGSDDPDLAQLAVNTRANQAYAFPEDNGRFAGAVEVLAVDSMSAAAESVYAAIMAAAADSGSINIVAYSGGAGAFSAAHERLPQAVRDRIASIIYLAPGALGSVPSTGAQIFSGADIQSSVAAFLMNSGSIPVTPTDCGHTDRVCLLGAAANALGSRNSSSCSNPSVYVAGPDKGSLGPPKPIVTPGFGRYATIATGFGGAASGYESGQWNYTDSYYDYMGAMNADWNYDPFSYMREYFALRRFY